MQQQLRDIFLSHDQKISDKWSTYLEKYERYFHPYQNQSINLLEIGVLNGGSLEIWGKYFINAKKLVGIDSEEKCRSLSFADPRIVVCIGDANTEATIEQVLKESPDFDIVIDDGSHLSSDVIKSFGAYFSHLNPGGIYIVEDLHTSYWNNYGGGLHNPYSSMSFFTRLADVINHEHWRNKKSREDYLAEYERKYNTKLKETDLDSIHSIQFFNSLVFIQKREPQFNTLGKRTVAGRDEIITNGQEGLAGTQVDRVFSEVSDDSDTDIFSLMEQVQHQQKTIDEQAQAILQLDSREKEILNISDQLKEQARVNQAQQEALLSEKQQLQTKYESTLKQHENQVKEISQLKLRELKLSERIDQLTDEAKRLKAQAENLLSENKHIRAECENALAQKEHQVGEVLRLGERERVLSESLEGLTAQNQGLQTEINALKMQQKELSDILQALKQETVAYALSGSWKLTRPLRKLSRLFRRK